LPVPCPVAQLSSKKRRTAQFRADFFVFALLCRLACEPNELVAEDRDDEMFTGTFSGTTSYILSLSARKYHGELSNITAKPVNITTEKDVINSQNKKN
jgi:hypothetical protein